MNESLLPGKILNIDVVVESTGFSLSLVVRSKHMDAGAKRVVISAPAKMNQQNLVRGATVLMGSISDQLVTCDISSNASCTTNATSPVVAVLKRKQLVSRKQFLTLCTHTTATQSLVDGPAKKDLVLTSCSILFWLQRVRLLLQQRRTLNLKEVRWNRYACSVPVGSNCRPYLYRGRETTVEEINEALRKRLLDPRWKNILAATDEPIVSTDIIGARSVQLLICHSHAVGGKPGESAGVV